MNPLNRLFRAPVSTQAAAPTKVAANAPTNSGPEAKEKPASGWTPKTTLSFIGRSVRQAGNALGEAYAKAHDDVTKIKR